MDRLSQKFEGIGAVLLASGFSRRMGQNKLLLPLGRELKPCIRIVAEALIDSGVGELVVVYQEEEIFQVLKDLPLTFIKNLKAEQGQSESVKLGAAHGWKANINAIAYCVGDQPLFTAACYQKLFEAYGDSEANIVLPCVGGETFSPVIFDFSWREALLTLEGDQGGKVLLNSSKAVVRRVSFNEKIVFMDMDVPEDYETLKGLMNSPEAWRESV